MIGARHIVAADWTPVAQGFEARLALPGAMRVAAWAQGPPVPDASLATDTSEPVPFEVLGDTAFAAGQAGAAIRLLAPAPPRRCVVLLRPPTRHSPALAPFWPAAVACPAARPAPDPGAARARLDAALAGHDLDGALAVVAEMLLASRGAAATQDAAAALLAHLARHPLCRSPALGAFVAALAE